MPKRVVKSKKKARRSLPASAKAKGKARKKRVSRSARASRPERQDRVKVNWLKKEFAVLHNMAKSLTSTLKVDDVLQTIMEKIEELLSPDNWSLLLLDESTNELHFQIVRGEGAHKLKETRIKVGEGIAGWVAQSGEAAIVSDVSKDSRFSRQGDFLTRTRTQSIACVPVQFRNKMLGVIEIINYRGHRGFSQKDMDLLQPMADYAAIALQNAFYVEKIHELTITDDLTGLRNSRYFYEVLSRELHRSKRYGFHFSLLFIDLDHFKKVNDTHGHLVGSRLLHDVAQVMIDGLRETDLAFRYGGDEFVFLLSHTDREGALKLGRRLQDKLSATEFMKDVDLNLRISASMGVATFPTDATTKEELIRLADEAMYEIKNTTRGGISAPA